MKLRLGPVTLRFLNFHARMLGVLLLVVGVVSLRAAVLSESDRALSTVFGLLAIVGGVSSFIVKPAQLGDDENIFSGKRVPRRKGTDKNTK